MRKVLKTLDKDHPKHSGEKLKLTNILENIFVGKSRHVWCNLTNCCNKALKGCILQKCIYIYYSIERSKIRKRSPYPTNLHIIPQYNPTINKIWLSQIEIATPQILSSCQIPRSLVILYLCGCRLCTVHIYIYIHTIYL